VPLISEAEQFDTLLATVSQCLDDLPGIDECLVFVTALRIGMQMHLEPQRIYLHPEVRDGASQLLELDDASSSLEKSQLPALLQHPDLPVAVIQGCLTMCRQQLRWLRLKGVLS